MAELSNCDLESKIFTVILYRKSSLTLILDQLWTTGLSAMVQQSSHTELRST